MTETPTMINWKGKKAFSPTGFQGFQFTADWPHGFWPAERQSITVLSTLKRWASHHSSIEQGENGDRQLSVNLFVMCLITFLSSIRPHSKRSQHLTIVPETNPSLWPSGPLIQIITAPFILEYLLWSCLFVIYVYSILPTILNFMLPFI